MDILKCSQLVIFSHSTILITFPIDVLQVFSSNSYEVRGGENRKWRSIFAFDRCVHQSMHKISLDERCKGIVVMLLLIDSRTIPVDFFHSVDHQPALGTGMRRTAKLQRMNPDKQQRQVDLNKGILSWLIVEISVF